MGHYARNVREDTDALDLSGGGEMTARIISLGRPFPHVT
jgi:hypothetical protein